jgi:putative transposase
MNKPNSPPQRKQIRLKGWNYATPWWYFVTVCTQDRKPLLGHIVDGEMVLNDAGKMVDKWWLKIHERFKTVELDFYQIMPNHLHGIIIVGARSPRPSLGSSDPDNGRGNPAPTLGQIVAYFKYQSTKQINALNGTPGKRLFQRNYYEHIIRNERSLFKIRWYIKNNPRTWERDRNNPKNW